MKRLSKAIYNLKYSISIKTDNLRKKGIFSAIQSEVEIRHGSNPRN
jgi:hypothetical protein